MSHSKELVQLYIYDLSRGLARSLSASLLGTTIDGIWHTSVVVFRREYFFGSFGIQSCVPGGTVLGQPATIIDLGYTQVTREILAHYIEDLEKERFKIGSYDLLKHNCNNFSEELATFLTGSSIPKHILELPDIVLKTPLGQTWLRPFFDAVNVDPVSSSSNVGSQPVQTSSASLNSVQPIKMSDNENNDSSAIRSRDVAAGEAYIDDLEKDEAINKPKVPAIVFKDTCDILNEFQSLMRHIEPLLNDDDRSSLEELRIYVVENEGSWALGDNCLNFLGKVLREPDIPTDARVRLMNILSVAALRDDIILILHQDRRDHVLMTYAQSIDRLSVPEQEAVATFLCNLFENTTTSEWLLYISEWPGSNNAQLSNIRVTTKVAVTALLADGERLKERGTALMFNLATKEVKTVKMSKTVGYSSTMPKGSLSKVFDDVATELAMAILQFLSASQSEEYVFRALKALLRFTTVAHTEVPALIKMIGPDPESFRGMSKRVDEIIEPLAAKVRNVRGF